MKEKTIILFVCLTLCVIPLSSQLTSPHPKGPAKEVIEKSYHTVIKGRKITPVNAIFDELIKYDPIGNEIELIEFHNQGALWEGHKNTYNNKGNKIGQYTWYDGDSTKIASIDSICYDSLNNQTIIFHCHQIYGRELKTTLQLNQKGQITSEEFLKYDSLVLSTVTYDYDQKGNKIKETILDTDSRIPYNNYYRYNIKGELIFEETGKYGYQHYYEYQKHDKFGNWTRRIQRTKPDGTYVFVTDRVVKYYTSTRRILKND